MLTQDEINRVSKAANIDNIDYYSPYSNDRFPDTIIESYIDEDDTINTLLFEKSQSNEGYNKFKITLINYYNGDDGLTSDMITEDTPNSNILYPFPGQLTEDLVLNAARISNKFNNNINVFLSDHDPQIGFGTDDNGFPIMFILYAKYSSENMGIYQYEKLSDINQLANTHWIFYEVDGQLLSEHDYNQFIENK